MGFSPHDQIELGGLLMMGGLICFLVWLFLHLLWVIGLVFVVAGLVLFLSGKMQK